MHFHKLFIKLLENPLSIPILHLLSNKPLPIPQITESLKNTDTPTVIAVLGELYHFGLVKRVQTPMMNSSVQNQINSHREETKLSQEHRLIAPSPLGIPLHEHVSLWEEVLEHPDQMNFNGMNNWIFSIPENLRNEIKDLKLEEIRKKLLNRGF